jgi:hypothetical protein
VKKFKPNYNQLVVVDWYDAVVEGDWKVEAKGEIHECTTAGFVIDETDKYVCVASTISRNQSNARISIPKAWIVRRRTLKLTVPKRVHKEKSNGSGTVDINTGSGSDSKET